MDNRDNGTNNTKSNTQQNPVMPVDVLVFDTETRIDYKQTMTIAVFRLYELVNGTGVLKNRWLVYNRAILDLFDEVNEMGAIQRAYDNGSPCPWNPVEERVRLKVIEKDEFIRKVFKYKLRKRITLLAFNLPFDLSRLACHVRPNRAGDGFVFWFATNPNNPDAPDCHISKIKTISVAKHITFYSLCSPSDKFDDEDKDEFKGGHVEFVDAATLSYALSGKSGSLKECGKMWECEVRKSEADEYGAVTSEHIQYCENDVAATFSLYQKLLVELKEHPIAISPAKLYSGASLTKAYWRTMGILKSPPFVSDYPGMPATITPLEFENAKQAREQAELEAYNRMKPWQQRLADRRNATGKAVTSRSFTIGDALKEKQAAWHRSRELVVWQRLMEGYFAGRSECRIRKLKTPIVYCDFMSQYPTVTALMKLWSVFTAEKYTAVECTQDTQQLLIDITLDDCFKPENWPYFRRICRIRPNGDLLPVRTKYNEFSDFPNIALAYLNHNSIDLWYTLPDLIASKLLTGRAPQVDEAYQIQQPNTRLMWWERNYDLKPSPPMTVQGAVEKPRPGIKAVKIRGAETAMIKPGDDFFQKTINLRKLVQKSNELSENDRERLGQALKIMANSGYGSFVEVDVKTGENAKFSIPTTAITGEVANREDGGKYFFPPVGVFITAGGRLLLAMAQAAVEETGLKCNGVRGSYTFLDTDSIGIVADEQGGAHITPTDVFNPLESVIGASAVPIVTLSWKQVDEILERFASLNPYQDQAGQTILEKEKENYVGDDKSAPQRPIYFYGISRKRYHIITEKDEIVLGSVQSTDTEYSDEDELVKITEHGLGTLIPPYAVKINPETDADDLVKLDLEEFAELAYLMARAGYGEVGVEFDTVKMAITGADGSIRLGNNRFKKIYWERFALRKIRIQTPNAHKVFNPLNEEAQSYNDMVKPYNFMESFQPANKLILNDDLGRGPFVRAGDNDRSKQEALTGEYEPSAINRSKPYIKRYFQGPDELAQAEVQAGGLDNKSETELSELGVRCDPELFLVKPVNSHQDYFASNEFPAKTYLDVIRDYIEKGETPLEPSHGVGMLRHNPILVIGKAYIGKETNLKDEREAGVLTQSEERDAASEFRLEPPPNEDGIPVLRGDMDAIKALLCRRDPSAPGEYWPLLETQITKSKLAQVIGVGEREVKAYMANKRFPTNEGLNKLIYYLQTEVIPEFVGVRFNAHFESVKDELKRRVFTSIIREYLKTLLWETTFFDLRLKEWWCGYDLWVQEDPNAPFLPASPSFPRRREQQAKYGVPPGTLLQDTQPIKKHVPGHSKAKPIDWYDRPAAGIRACDFGIQTVWTSPCGKEIWNKVKDRFEPKPEIEQLSDDDLAKKMAALQREIDRIQKIERTINNEPAQIIIVCVPVKDRENYLKVETAEGPPVGTAGQTMKSVFITEEDNDLRYSKNSVRALYDYIHQEFLRRRSITEEPALNDRTEGQ